MGNSLILTSFHLFMKLRQIKLIHIHCHTFFYKACGWKVTKIAVLNDNEISITEVEAVAFEVTRVVTINCKSSLVEPL